MIYQFGRLHFPLPKSNT
nr:cytochrome c heme attachment protein [Helleborus torquatus]WIW41720.1 cytochrome c heme attachment protein [Helleborus torquatus]